MKSCRQYGLEGLGRMKAIERAVLKNRYSVYFANGREVFVTALSNDAAERKASRSFPGIKVRFSQALDTTDFLRTLGPLISSARVAAKEH